MVDKEFKNKMMNIIREDARGSNMMCGGTLINIDEMDIKVIPICRVIQKRQGERLRRIPKIKTVFIQKV